MLENQQYDKKSITFLKGKNTDWNELAKDCVCFAIFQEIKEKIDWEI